MYNIKPYPDPILIQADKAIVGDWRDWEGVLGADADLVPGLAKQKAVPAWE